VIDVKHQLCCPAMGVECTAWKRSTQDSDELLHTGSAVDYPQSCWGAAQPVAPSSPKLLGDNVIAASRLGRVKCCGASE
jgi:hypothetical protein